jgi:hypothetical protein
MSPAKAVNSGSGNYLAREVVVIMNHKEMT